MRPTSMSFVSGQPAAQAEARRGYTLMELLIAMCLLIVLGGGLATFLGHGVSTWRRAENRGRVHETARALLEGIADDLRSTAIRTGPRRVERGSAPPDRLRAQARLRFCGRLRAMRRPHPPRWDAPLRAHAPRSWTQERPRRRVRVSDGPGGLMRSSIPWILARTEDFWP